MSGAERARRYRARRKLRAVGPSAVAPVSDPVLAAWKHGADASDVDDAVAERLESLPQYLTAAAFRDAAQVVFRRVERAARLGAWVQGMGEESACTPRKAGGSTPEEISRHADDSALRGLAQLGLTPASAAKFAARLEQSLKPDLAQLAAQARLEGWAEEEGGEGA